MARAFFSMRGRADASDSKLAGPSNVRTRTCVGRVHAKRTGYLVGNAAIAVIVPGSTLRAEIQSTPIRTKGQTRNLRLALIQNLQHWNYSAAWGDRDDHQISVLARD